METRYWLEWPRGSALRITPAGILFGRDPACDVILDNPRASKAHALVRGTPTGPRLFVLGRNPSLLNGVAADQGAALREGDVVELPGCTVRVRARGPRPRVRRCWVLSTEEVGAVGLGDGDFTVGGGDDDLRVKGWPEGALVFRRVQGSLTVEVRHDLLVSGDPVAAGAVELPGETEVFRHGDVEVHLRAGPPGDDVATEIGGECELPREVRFEFLPRGGKLDLVFDGRTQSVMLSELRARLMAVLLDPGLDRDTGGWISDDALIPQVWSGKADRGRTDVNLLIHHTRKALLAADIDPSLLARLRTGGATAFRTAPAAAITLT